MAETDTLSQLMQQGLAGDQHAYHQFLSEITPYIRRIVRQKISDDVEDVVQETLMSLHQARHTYTQDKPVKPWAAAICRYRIADHLRTRYKYGTAAEINENFIAPVTSDPLTGEYINELMTTLSDTQRQIILAMKRDGFSAAEAALQFGMSLSAVKVAAHRGLKKMRKYHDEND